ncbi:hypothetical protein KIN20_033594 [Parelaphostrongylus tenuis]|uniref:Uncharacterized protein n=1 Tax=Parelaphostrongylus tenuis TaxID=148309 RepID=A0AAD5R891_PARTN|nr:hypothetical protein KIN20_033594 [Parelaphostrongylus tenuis]
MGRDHPTANTQSHIKYSTIIKKISKVNNYVLVRRGLDLEFGTSGRVDDLSVTYRLHS